MNVLRAGEKPKGGDLKERRVSYRVHNHGTRPATPGTVRMDKGRNSLELGDSQKKSSFCKSYICTLHVDKDNV